MGMRSHLHAFHEEHGKITEFGGFDMPLWYDGIIEEHHAVRNAAGLFDVSHMGRFRVRGEDATKFLNIIFPSDVEKIRPGRAFYSLILNGAGGIVDDTVTNKISDNEYFMVVNAANREKDLKWLLAKKSESSYSCSVEDESDSTALIALQGPLAVQISRSLCDFDLGTLKRFGFVFCAYAGEKSLVSRTGYTGEDGFEIAVLDSPVDSPGKAMNVWQRILEQGKQFGLKPCGLGARDLLRLEAGMCLYGQDIDETTTPLEASLEGIVDLRKSEPFIGRERLEAQSQEGLRRKRVAFSMIESGIPRHGYQVTIAGSVIGNVTSGTFSPIEKKGIGMAYVPPALSNIGDRFSINLRGVERGAAVSQVPFYDPTRFGYRRKPGS